MLVDNKGSERFKQGCKRVKEEDKKIVEYEELTHMIIHDNKYIPEITKELVDWFDRYN